MLEDDFFQATFEDKFIRELQEMEAEVITLRDLTKVKKQIYAIQRIIMGLQIQGRAGSPIAMVNDKKLALFKQASITSSVEGGSDVVIDNQKTGEKDWLKYLAGNR